MMNRYTKGRFINTKTITVAALVAGGVLIRLKGLDYGLPLVYHPDENRQILDALGMAQRMSPIPGEFSYPALHKYIVVAASGVYYAVGRLMGWFTDPMDFAASFLAGETKVFLVARLLSVFAGLLTGISAYVMGSRLWNERTGLIAMAFAMAMFHLVQHSQWALADIYLALFTTLSLYYAMSFSRGVMTGDFYMAALFTGLAAATKPQGLFLLLPLALAGYMGLRSTKKVPHAVAVEGLKGAFIFSVVAISGNLAWLFDPGPVYEKFRMLSQVATIGISSQKPFEPGAVTMFLWFIKELVRQETILGLVITGGLVYALYRREKEDLILLSYIAVFFFAVRNWAIRYLHLFVASFPVLCVFGARFLSDLMDKVRVRGSVAALLVITVIAPSVYDSLKFGTLKEGIDTRLLAKGWIEEHVPAGTTIALDWYEFPVPLSSEVPPGLWNPKARSFYEEMVPEGVKERYMERIRNKRLYKVVGVIYSTDEPAWPAGIDQDTLQRLRSKEVYRELYSVFNFRTLDELKGLGCRYLIITSYSYCNFLLDDDPEKTPEGVFNYLFKEDMLGFNHQAKQYNPGDRFGLLYFLDKRARDFYEPLLRGGSPAVLVKEFRPGAGTPGPVIKIFRL